MDSRKNICYITIGCSTSGKSEWCRRKQKELGITHFEYDRLKKDSRRNGRGMTDFLIDLVNGVDGDCAMDNVFSSPKTIKYIDERLTNHRVVLVLFDISLDELYRHRESTTRSIMVKPRTENYVEKIHANAANAIQKMKCLDGFEKIIVTDDYFKDNYDESIVLKKKREISRTRK